MLVLISKLNKPGGATDQLIAIATPDKRSLENFCRHAQMIFQDPYSTLSPRITVRDIEGIIE